jgi:hypothetical protein
MELQKCSSLLIIFCIKFSALFFVQCVRATLRHADAECGMACTENKCLSLHAVHLSFFAGKTAIVIVGC